MAPVDLLLDAGFAIVHEHPSYPVLRFKPRHP
jgi:hypothetical protein